ncbi:hypothetical protein [Actinoplanes sp. DH11]|uniref:hypothetical protein n=1 Tax=Actinoplanes sp. DH11 TaxID=2857011 RepID=UPI001E29AE9D|nr:hypothetical protein [Actinoplanes sp. DH11]
MNAVVHIDALGPMRALNSGANGVIHRLDEFRLPDEPGELVFKQYRKGATPVPVHGLATLVAVRRRLVKQRKAALDELAAWPLRAVIGPDNEASGVLMRLIPGHYFEEMSLPSGARARVPREIQHLIADPGQGRLGEVDVPADGDADSRLRICERFAFALSLLHGARIVFGDVSARNVLYRLRPRPSVYLVDCDAARLTSTSAVNRQMHSPDWDPPEKGEQTLRTDRYKLGLFVLRCLTPGKGSSLNRDLTAAAPMLDGRGTDLLRRSLEGAPGDRPLAREWLFHLRARLGDRPMPPMPAEPGVPVTTPHETGWRRGPDGWIPA